MTWLRDRGGIVRRSDALDAGFSPISLRRAGARLIARRWLVTDGAPPHLVAAAARRGRLTCVSAAAHHELALPEQPSDLHLSVGAHASTPTEAGLRLHRARLLAPPHDLVVSGIDLLAHTATCLPRIDALIIWESALRRRFVSAAELPRIGWASRAARDLARSASALSDSILETVLLHALRGIGLPVRQQVRLDGHRVDFLVGSRLVIQTDGRQHRTDAAQQRIDAEHDARLLLAGFHVIRLTYAHVMHELPRTLDLIRRAVAQGLHAA